MENLFEKTFDGRPVRLVNVNGEVVMPLPDIAEALKYDKKTLRNIVDRNMDVFETCRVVTTLQDKDGRGHKSTCLTRDGVVGLLMKLATSRIKDPAKKQMVVNFQRWAIRTIGEVLEGICRAPRAADEGYNQALVHPAVKVFEDIWREARAGGGIAIRTGRGRRT